jgi:hypothetical protein
MVLVVTSGLEKPVREQGFSELIVYVNALPSEA